MRKKELIKLHNKQQKTIENMLDVFKILVEGGEVAVHIYKDEPPAYFVHPKGNKNCDAMFSKKIYEGLYSRGLLVLNCENIHEDFAVQRYALRNKE